MQCKYTARFIVTAISIGSLEDLELPIENSRIQDRKKLDLTKKSLNLNLSIDAHFAASFTVDSIWEGIVYHT